MFVKTLFDENPNAMTLQDIKSQPQITPEKETLLLHNNFGIC